MLALEAGETGSEGVGNQPRSGLLGGRLVLHHRHKGELGAWTLCLLLAGQRPRQCGLSLVGALTEGQNHVIVWLYWFSLCLYILCAWPAPGFLPISAQKSLEGPAPTPWYKSNPTPHPLPLTLAFFDTLDTSPRSTHSWFRALVQVTEPDCTQSPHLQKWA